MTVSTTLELRTATRQSIRSTQDKRVLKPFDYDLIDPIIHPLYAAIWQDVKTGKISCTIQVQYTPDMHDEFIAFLRGWIEANGYNRESLESHVTELIGFMRDGFCPEATNFSVDVSGRVNNGGHSGKALLRAFFPRPAYYGLHGKPLTFDDKPMQFDDWLAEQPTAYDDGSPFDPTYGGYYFANELEQVCESILPAMPSDTITIDGEETAKYPELGEFDESGEYVPESDTPELREQYIDKVGKKQPLRLVVNVSVFGPATALHRENTTLVPTAETYLSMNGHIKTHYAESIPSWLKGKVGSLLTMVRKRTMHSSTGFGTVGRGGRMNGEDAPSWYLAYMPQVIDSIALLVDTQGSQIPRPLFTPSKGDANTPAYKGGANILQLLTAMAVSDQSGRERIAKWVCGTGDDYKANAGLRKLVDLVRPPKNSTVGNLPADAVVELLVLIGLGKTDPVDVFSKDWQRKKGDDMESINAWLVEECRAIGWDRGDVDSLPDGDDTLSTSLVEYAKQLSGEDSRAAKSAARKAPKGKPKGK